MSLSHSTLSRRVAAGVAAGLTALAIRELPVTLDYPAPADAAAAESLPPTCSRPARVAGDSGTRMLMIPVEAPYALVETSVWGNPLEEGERALLYRGTILIDTVDLTFGVGVVGGDSLVFLPVRTWTAPAEECSPDDGQPPCEEHTTTEHELWTPTGRRELREIVPHFDSYFSSPAIEAATLYYWGIARDGDNNGHRIYAVRYDFRTGQLDSLRLGRGYLETDYRYYFGLPHWKSGMVAFDGTLIDPRTWTVTARAPHAKLVEEPEQPR